MDGNGRLCITGVVELARVLTPENRREVLPRFFHRSRREAREVAVEVCPVEAVPRREVLRVVTHGGHLDERAVRVRAAAVQPAEQDGPYRGRPVQPDELPAARPPAAGRSDVNPLTADLSRLHVTVSRRFVEKLEAARSALSHARPGATAEEILEAGLDLLLERQARRKGLVARPRAATAGKKVAPRGKPQAGTPSRTQGAPPDSRHIPAAVRREVWIRDGGRCQWALERGGVCGSTQRLEFDHVVPRSRARASTAAGIRLLCRFHNDLAARQAFGDRFMDRFRRDGPRVGPRVEDGPVAAYGARDERLPPGATV